MKHPAASDFGAAQDLLQQGKLVVMPTDTIYGVIASAFHQKAIGNLYKLRREDTAKPFIILIADRSDIQLFGIEASPLVQERLDRLWPGPTSIALECPDPEYAYLHRRHNSLAFRVPDYPELRHFLRQTGTLAAPSANLAGQLPATTVAEAEAYFGSQVAAYIDGGPIAGSASRLIALSPDGSEQILRP